MAGVSDAMDRGETYAEMILEGKLLPSQELLRMVHASVTVERARKELGAPPPPPALAGQLEADLAEWRGMLERTITKDMDVLKSWISMAWYCGYQSAIEERHSRTKGGRK